MKQVFKTKMTASWGSEKARGNITKNISINHMAVARKKGHISKLCGLFVVFNIFGNFLFTFKGSFMLLNFVFLGNGLILQLVFEGSKNTFLENFEVKIGDF